MAEQDSNPSLLIPSCCSGFPGNGVPLAAPSTLEEERAGSQSVDPSCLGFLIPGVLGRVFLGCGHLKVFT